MPHCPASSPAPPGACRTGRAGDGGHLPELDRRPQADRSRRPGGDAGRGDGCECAASGSSTAARITAAPATADAVSAARRRRRPARQAASAIGLGAPAWAAIPRSASAIISCGPLTWTPPCSPDPGTAEPTATGRLPCASGCARSRPNTPGCRPPAPRAGPPGTAAPARPLAGRKSQQRLPQRQPHLDPGHLIPRLEVRHLRHRYLGPPGTTPPPADLLAVHDAPHVTLGRAVDPPPVRGGLGQRALQQILGRMLIAGQHVGQAKQLR